MYEVLDTKVSLIRYFGTLLICWDWPMPSIVLDVLAPNIVSQLIDIFTQLDVNIAVNKINV